MQVKVQNPCITNAFKYNGCVADDLAFTWSMDVRSPLFGMYHKPFPDVHRKLLYEALRAT